MQEIWEHRCVTADDEPRQWAATGETLIVETRPPGSLDETVTTLTALDAVSGEVRWQFDIAPLGVNQAIVVDRGLLAMLHVGKRQLVRGYDLATGAERWTHRLTGEPRGVAWLGSDLVVVSGTTVQKLDRDGHLIASATIPGSQLTTLAVTEDGDIITANGRGKRNVLRLAGDSLDVRWDLRIPGEGWTYRQAPLVVGDTVYFHSTSMWAMAIDVATGDVRWRKKKMAGRGGAVVPGPDGDVLWGTDTLSRLRARDGKAVWSTPRVTTATMTEDVSRVVIARRVDPSYAYEPDTRIDVRVELLDAAKGEAISGVDLTDVRRHWVAGGMSDRLFAVIGGTLVSGLESGRVRAFRLGT